MLNPSYAPSTGKARGKGPRGKKSRRRRRVANAVQMATERNIKRGSWQWRSFMRSRGLDEFTGCPAAQVRYARMAESDKAKSW